MTLPASIEAPEYSRWDDDDADPEVAETGCEEGGRGVPGSATNVETSAARIDRPDGAATAPLVLTAGDEADGGRLDKWLAARLPAYSRARIQRWIGDGHVRIAGRVVAVRDRVWKDDAVEVAPQASDDEQAFAAEPVALEVVHEDESLFVLDKRAGLVVHPASGNWSGTVLNGLLHLDPSLATVPRAGIVHRLDKDTSGLMVVARSIVAQTDLVRQLQARTVGRTYLAIAHGTTPRSGRITWPIGRDPRERTRMTAFSAPGDHDRSGAKPAATRFETLASIELAPGRSASLVICRLETGRTPQIRVHLQALGHPLVGDAPYGGRRAWLPFDRQALHAWQLRLVHPHSGLSMAWTAALPADLAGLASSLGFDVDRLLASAPIDA